MKTFATLFIIFISIHTYGQEYYFINAKNGLNVRSDSNLSSTKVAKIPFGVMVEKISDTDKTLVIEDNGKQIKGKFIKIRYNNYVYLVSEETKPFEREGYVFDGYLKKQKDKNLISTVKIEKTVYTQLLKSVSKKKYNPKKIENLDSIKTILKKRVKWSNNDGSDDFIKSITTKNGQKLLLNDKTDRYGFSGGKSDYYPEYDILVLEGGHSSDMCFSIKTGETHFTIGNPEYMIPSPKGTYRLNGSFGGQECTSYFFQKYENGNFIYLTEFGDDYDICTFKEFYWINETKFIYKILDYTTDSVNGTEEYFKGEIKSISISTTKFKSNLRPNKTVSINQIYTDTIVFKSYNDDYDYFLLIGKKKKREVALIYNWARNNNKKYNFKYGDLIVVKWKMDSIWNTGEGDALDFKEKAIDAEKIMSKNKQIKFLWRAEKFDEELKQNFNSIFINEPFSNSISNPEKAALGYVATFIGNECKWDGKANENRSNLKCKILTALDLGYQCSDKHFGFLRKWFSKDTVALKELENCVTMPYTATVQTTFDEISIVTDKDNKIITVTYKVRGINIRESKNWSWTQTDTFKYDSENITLIDSEKTELKN